MDLTYRRATSMRNYDVTDTVEKYHPILQELLTEKEFLEFLAQHNIKLKQSSLRDYRHRDKKFAYIKKGQQVFYPKILNNQIIKDELSRH